MPSSSTAIAPNQQEANCDRRLMIFAPWCYGHHPIYLGHLIRYWHEQHLPGSLDVIVLPEFLNAHADVVDAATAQGNSSVRFIALTKQEQSDLETKHSGLERAFLQYQLICKYATWLNATQGLILYFDSCQIPLVLGKTFPCTFSGIYFRPTFHYSQLAGYTPDLKERVQQLRERLFLSRILQNATFKSLFCLDPLAVPLINQFCHQLGQAIHLPDPIEVNGQPDTDGSNLKQHLGIDAHRMVFLLFGRLADSRKGTQEAIAALASLPHDLGQRIALVVVGEPNPTGQVTLDSWLIPLCQPQSVQVIRQYGFVPDAMVSSYFQLADVVLAPYQRHVGMSGILLQAAAAQKPVLSSDYGLMGEMTRRYQLGLAVDSTQPEAIANGVVRLLSEPVEHLCDRTLMQQFVEQNSAKQFAQVIFQNM